METIMVTGAGGYIGSHVVDALRQYDDVRIIAVDYRLPDQTCKYENVSWVQSNLFEDDLNVVFGALTPVDGCIHLAWRDGFNHNSDSHMHDLSQHYDFLNKIIGFGVKRIAVMGTMHEVGYWEGPITEDTPCSPQSYYGIAKDALRRSFLLKAIQSDVIAMWLRAFYIYGDDARSQSIFGKITQAAARGERTFPFTSGTNKFDFIEVHDLARQIAACIMQTQVSGVINCCSGTPVALSEQVEDFIAKKGFDIKLEYGAFPDRPYDSPEVWGDPSKINAIMGSSLK